MVNRKGQWKGRELEEEGVEGGEEEGDFLFKDSSAGLIPFLSPLCARESLYFGHRLLSCFLSRPQGCLLRPDVRGTLIEHLFPLLSLPLLALPWEPTQKGDKRYLETRNWSKIFTLPLPWDCTTKSQKPFKVSLGTRATSKGKCLPPVHLTTLLYPSW